MLFSFFALAVMDGANLKIRLAGLNIPLAVLAIVTIIGVIVALIEPNTNYNRLIAYSITMCALGSAAILGLNSPKSKKNILPYYIIFAVMASIAVLIWYLEPLLINKNWAALQILFPIFLLQLKGAYKLNLILLYLLSISFSMLVFSRGALLMGIIALLSTSFLPILFKSKKIYILTKFTVIIAPIFMIIFSFWLVDFYRTETYDILNRWSLEYFQRSLTSFRIVMWEQTVYYGSENLFLGGGITDDVLSLNYFTSFGAVHNLWFDYYIRFGLFGIISIALIMAYFAVGSVSSPANGLVCTPVYLALLLAMIVYNMGGLTHWPGSVFTWYLFGLIMKRNNNQNDSRNRPEIYRHKIKCPLSLYYEKK